MSVSRVVSHHSSSDAATHATGTSSTARSARPPLATTEREPLRIARAGTGRARRGPAAPCSPSSIAAVPGRGHPGVDARELAQTASTARPPGRSTRAISAAARSMSGTSMSPKRQRTRVDASSARAELGSVLDLEANVLEPELGLRGGAPPRPSRARRRSRSARRPAGAAAARVKPVSPGPAASSSTRSPGCGSSSCDHALGEQRRRPREEARVGAPSRPRRSASAATCCGGVVVYAVTPLNCGRMSRRRPRASPPGRASSGRS